jgi:hypothetical protein
MHRWCAMSHKNPNVRLKIHVHSMSMAWAFPISFVGAKEEGVKVPASMEIVEGTRIKLGVLRSVLFGEMSGNGKSSKALGLRGMVLDASIIGQNSQ